MTREEAKKILQALKFIVDFENYSDRVEIAIGMAIEALKEQRPHGEWIAKNEYRRGWHDAITKALSEMMKVHVENETFDMVQKETLIGLGLSMDSALGAEPYSETEKSYPEPDRPRGMSKSKFTKQQLIREIHCMWKFNYTLASNEVFTTLVQLVRTAPDDMFKKEGEAE